MRRVSTGFLIAVVIMSILLPWFTVSCSGEPIATATGADVALGSVDMSALEPLAASDDGAAGFAEGVAAALLWGRIWIVAVLTLCVVGLGVSLVGQPGTAPWLTRVLALQLLLLAIVLPTVAVALPRALISALGAEIFGRPVDSPAVQTVIAGIRVNAEAGYWTAVAATFVGLTLSALPRRRALAPTSVLEGRSTPSALPPPGLFTSPASIALAYHDGANWRHVGQSVVTEDRFDLGRLQPQLEGIMVQCAANRVTIEGNWSSPVTLHRGAQATVLDPAPQRLVVWPGDSLVVGGWSFAFAGGV